MYACIKPVSQVLVIEVHCRKYELLVQFYLTAYTCICHTTSELDGKCNEGYVCVINYMFCIIIVIWDTGIDAVCQLSSDVALISWYENLIIQKELWHVAVISV